MSSKQTLVGKMQSAKDNEREAMNSSSGFKNVPSAGTQGIADMKNKR